MCTSSVIVSHAHVLLNILYRLEYTRMACAIQIDKFSKRKSEGERSMCHITDTELRIVYNVYRHCVTW